MQPSNIIVKFFSSIVFLLILLIAVPGSATAVTQPTAPTTITYQGRLNNNTGSAVTTGSYTFKFRIYNASTGGTLLWGPETHTLAVQNGIFSASLGSIVSFASAGLDFNSSPYYLTLEVNNDGEMSPRQPIEATPFAIHSGTTFGTFTASADPSTPYAGALYYNTTANTLYVSDGTSWNNLSLSGNAFVQGGNALGTTAIFGTTDSNSLRIQSALAAGGTTTEAIRVASTNTLGSSDELFQIQNNGTNLATMLGNGNLGIGTVTPTDSIDITGDLTTGRQLVIHNNYALGAELYSHAAAGFRGPTLSLMRSQGTQSSPTAVQSLDKLGYLQFFGYDGAAYQTGASIEVNTESAWSTGVTPAYMVFTTAGTERMRMSSAGNLGIGTTNTVAKLNVNGDIALNYGMLNLGGLAGDDSYQISVGPSVTRYDAYGAHVFRTGLNGLETEVLQASSTGLWTEMDGSAAVPVITFGSTADANTGIFHPAADTLALSTSGLERFRIDSNGFVGIGSSSPLGSGVKRLEVAGSGGGTTDYGSIALSNTGGGGSRIGGSVDYYTASNLIASVRGVGSSAVNTGRLVFSTSNAGTFTDKWAIYPDGKFNNIANGNAESAGTTSKYLAITDSVSGSVSRIMNLANTPTPNNTAVEIGFTGTDSSGTGVDFAAVQGIKISNTAGAVQGGLVFRTNNSGTFQESVRIIGSGNVGIGVNAPTSQLDVAPPVSQSSTTATMRIYGTNGGALSTPMEFRAGGTQNTAIGYSAMNATTGSANTALGYLALSGATTGGNNIAIGGFALQSNTGGSLNTAIGEQVMVSNTNGGNNTAIGRRAMRLNTTGIDNTAIGLNAGSALTTGNYNVFLGSGADLVSSTTQSSFSSAIGFGARVGCTSCMTLGGQKVGSGADYSQNVGIASAYPTGERLHVMGSWVSGAGTMTTAAGSTSVTGVGTSWLSTLRVGSEISIGTEIRRVLSISSDTSLTVTLAFDSTQSLPYSYANPVFDVTTGGNVGIGIVNPSAPLVVNTVATGAAVTIADFYQSGSSRIALKYDSVSNNSSINLGGYTISQRTAAADISFSNSISLPSAGKLYSTSTSANYIQFPTPVSGANDTAAILFTGTQGNDAGNPVFRFWDNSAFSTHRVFGVGGGTTYTEYLTVRNDGNVGIGTTTPTEKLQVIGGISQVSSDSGSASSKEYVFTRSLPATNASGDYVEIAQIDNQRSVNLLLDLTENNSGNNNSVQYALVWDSTQTSANGWTQMLPVRARYQGSRYEVDIAGSPVTGTAFSVRLRLRMVSPNCCAPTVTIRLKTLAINSSTAVVAMTGTGNTTAPASYANSGVSEVQGLVGIGTPNPAYQLQLSTDSAAKPSTNTWTIASDERIKKNVQSFTDGLNTLFGIQPRTYQYNGRGGIGFDDTDTHIGIIAQELEQVAPYMVGKFEGTLDGQKTELLNYQGHALPFILTNAVKEIAEQTIFFPTAVFSIQQLKAGDVVYIESGSTPVSVKKTEKDYNSSVTAVIEKAYDNTEKGLTANGYMFQLRVAGIAKISTTDENGIVKIGDYVATSKNNPGKVMKVTKAGFVLGQVIADCGTNCVEVKLNNHYYTPSLASYLQLAGKDTADFSNFNQDNTIVLSDTVIDGSLFVTGSISVNGVVEANKLKAKQEVCIESDCVTREDILFLKQLRAASQSQNNAVQVPTEDALPASEEN